MRILILVGLIALCLAQKDYKIDLPDPTRLSDTVKGVLEERIIDYLYKEPKTIYGVRVPPENGKPERVVTLNVKDPSLVSLLPGSYIRAPVKQSGEDSYDLISYIRPEYSDDGQNAGSGGINGMGIQLIRIRTHVFIHRVHPQFDQLVFGARHHEMKPMVSGERSLVIMTINFRSKRLQVNMNDVVNWIFDGTDNVDKLYQDCTRGQVRFPKSKAKLVGPYTIDDPNDGLDTSPWLDQVKDLCTKASSADVDVTQFDHMIMILPAFSSADNGASGLATVGPECGRPCPVWINTGADYFVGGVSTVGHELGHNLGWGHAGVPTDGGFKVPMPRSSIEAEYGDWSALMGNGPPICPNFPHQLAQKWVSDTQMIGASVPSVALAPFGTPTPNALQGIILLTAPLSHYVSYRAITGPDTRFNLVDKEGRGAWSNAVYIHTDKSGKATTNLAKLGVGETFSKDNWSVKFSSLTNGIAYLAITVNDKDDCASKPCGANGDCIDQIGSYVCQCKKGWVGPNCDAQICYKFQVDGFSSSRAHLNGIWERTDDYASKVSYKKSGVILYFATPDKWMFGPDTGGQRFYAFADYRGDSPQFAPKWTDNTYQYSPKFTCLANAPPPPTVVCPKIQGQGFSYQTRFNNQIFALQQYVNNKPSYYNAQLKTYVFWTGDVWMVGGDVTKSSGSINSEEDTAVPQNAGTWDEYAASLGDWSTGKGKFVGLECPTGQAAVNCVGSWSDWSQCSASCGGSQTRTYKVTTPASNGGQICASLDGQKEQRNCGGPCSTPVNCVGSWSSWSQCSKTCGGGIQTRTYRVTTTAANGGAPCPAADSQNEKQDCNTAACVGPVNCVGSWSQWSTCSVTCGGGITTRTYTITTTPSNGGTPCEAASGARQQNTCGATPCSVPSPTQPAPTPTQPAPTPVNCLGSWSSWSACTTTCGGGRTSRTFSVSRPAQNGGAQCEASNGQQQTNSCNTQACSSSGSGKVDCSGGYTAWSRCSMPCGVGTYSRTYYVTKQPANGGAACPVADRTTETGNCLDVACGSIPSSIPNSLGKTIPPSVFPKCFALTVSGSVGSIALDGIYYNRDIVSGYPRFVSASDPQKSLVWLSSYKYWLFMYSQTPVAAGFSASDPTDVSKWAEKNGEQWQTSTMKVVCSRTSLGDNTGVPQSTANSAILSPASVLGSSVIIAVGIVVAAMIVSRRKREVPESNVVLL